MVSFIVLNDIRVNRQKNKVNRIQTAFYSTFVEYLIKGLGWCLFRSISSVYFLVVGILQVLTPFSTTGRWTTIVPHLFNKLYEMIMLYLDNKTRIIHDHSLNKQIYNLVPTCWSKLSTSERESIQLGDVIILEKGDIAPADLLIVNPEEEKLLMIDLKTITGEDNPVRRYPIVLNYKSIPAGYIHIERRWDQIKIKGDLYVGDQQITFGPHNIIPNGATINTNTNEIKIINMNTNINTNTNNNANAEPVYGIVLNMGNDTPIRPKRKRSKLDRDLNKLTIMCLLALMVLIGCSIIGHLYYNWNLYEMNGTNGMNRLNRLNRITINQFIRIIGSLMLIYFLQYNSLISQTVEFSLEVIRDLQIKSIYSRTNNKIFNRSSVDALGNINTLVIDKTGTLTQNKLIPKSIWTIGDFVWNFDYNHYIELINSNLPNSVTSKNLIDKNPIINMMYAIGLNNNLSPLKRDNKLEYIGSSRDEMVLETGLYESKIQNPHNPSPIPIMIDRIQKNGKEIINLASKIDQNPNPNPNPNHNQEISDFDSEWIERFEILYEGSYTSKRGMMSVCVRDLQNGRIFWIVKGNPNKMAVLLKEEDKLKLEPIIHKLSKKGYRLFLYAGKEISNDSIHNLSHSQTNVMIRDNFMKSLENAINMDQTEKFRREWETDLDIWGMTSIEDMLQPGVYQTITGLKKSGYNLILCSGDIQKTAINVAQKAGFMNNNECQNIYHLNLDSSSNANSNTNTNTNSNTNSNTHSNDLWTIKNKLYHYKANELTTLIIDNNVIKLINGYPQIESQLVDIIYYSYSTIVWGAEPDTKQILVRILQTHNLKSRNKNVKPIVAAIGDGANDVQMIRQADVGIGIIEGENCRAVDASDVAIRVVTELNEMLYLGGKAYNNNLKTVKILNNLKISVVFALFLWEMSRGFSTNSLFIGLQMLSFNLFCGWSVLFGAINLFRGDYNMINRDYFNKNDRVNKKNQKHITVRSLLLSWLSTFLSILFIMICIFIYLNDKNMIYNQVEWRLIPKSFQLKIPYQYEYEYENSYEYITNLLNITIPLYSYILFSVLCLTNNTLGMVSLNSTQSKWQTIFYWMIFIIVLFPVHETCSFEIYGLIIGSTSCLTLSIKLFG